MCYVLLDDGTVKNGFNLFDNSRQYLMSALGLIRKSALSHYVHGRSISRPTLPQSEMDRFRFTWRPLRAVMIIQDQKSLCSKEVPVKLTVTGYGRQRNEWFLQGEFCYGDKEPVTFNSHQLLDFHGYFCSDDDDWRGHGYLSVHMTA